MIFVVVDKIDGKYVFQAMFSNYSDALKHMREYGHDEVFEVDLEATRRGDLRAGS